MRRIVIILLAASWASAAASQRAPTAADPVLAEREAALRAEAIKMPDTGGTGRYTALKEVDPTLAEHVVYRPADLTRLGRRKLGIVLWGNGGCSDDAASGRQHLSEIASHGYLVIAPGAILSGPGARLAKPVTPATAPPASRSFSLKTKAADVLSGLGWALAENTRKSSRYYRRIDPKLVAVSGHSCGGLQALQAAVDPRIHAVIIHNSGIFADAGNSIAGMTVDKSLLLKLHTPVLYILGGPTDVAYPNGKDDFSKIVGVPAMLVNLPVGHMGTFFEKDGGRVAQVAVKWLDWQLRGDNRAAETFIGPKCGLCRDPAWTVESKKIN